jgi:stress-induced morphogen
MLEETFRGVSEIARQRRLIDLLKLNIDGTTGAPRHRFFTNLNSIRE